MEEEENLYECSSCYFIGMRLNKNDRPDKCYYCMCNKNMSSLDLLKRKLDVLNHTKIERFPDIIKHLVNHIELKE